MQWPYHLDLKVIKFDNNQLEVHTDLALTACVITPPTIAAVVPAISVSKRENVGQRSPMLEITITETSSLYMFTKKSAYLKCFVQFWATSFTLKTYPAQPTWKASWKTIHKRISFGPVTSPQLRDAE